MLIAFTPEYRLPMGYYGVLFELAEPVSSSHETRTSSAGDHLLPADLVAVAKTPYAEQSDFVARDHWARKRIGLVELARDRTEAIRKGHTGSSHTGACAADSGRRCLQRFAR